MDLPFKLVLVSTDFSPLGNAALPVALRLAHDHKCRLVVATVLEFPPPPNPMYAHYYPMPTAKQKTTARAKATKELEGLVAGLSPKGVACELEVLEGDAAAELAAYATAQKASVLVMSSHGRTGVKKLLLGSVAEKVLRHTTCPVLLVR